MALVTKLTFFIKLALSLAVTSVSNQTSYLLYLNHPETLTKPGILHKKQFTQDTNVRYFIHYKNGTDDSQKLSFTSQKVVKNMKKSFNSNQRPEYAGANTAENFLKSKTVDNKINVSTILQPEETISGMIEGVFSKGDTVLCKFVDSNQPINSLDIYQPSISYTKNFSIDYKSPVIYRLGDDINGYVPGQYGSNINLVVNPKANGLIKMTFSPRGGDGLLVFTNRGKIFKTKLLPAKGFYDILLIDVSKDQSETFSFIPTGGLNFPIRIKFEMVDSVTKNIS